MQFDESTSLQAYQEFLDQWPEERVRKMSLRDYTNPGTRDTFTYWIEQKLDTNGFGSIWGGSSFKFGVYRRNNTESREGSRGKMYDENYGWMEKYGETAEQAFVKVRSLIIEVIDAAKVGDLDKIEKIDLGNAYKWKIAFHYQDIANPKIVGVYIKAAMACFLGVIGADRYDYTKLYRELLAKKPASDSIFIYAINVWEKWASQPKIWKMSHGNVDFTSEEINDYLARHIVTIAEATKKSQGKHFKDNVNEGDYFYHCYSNKRIMLLGRFTSAAIPSSTRPEWLDREYEILQYSINPGPYTGEQKGWTPNYNSTLKAIVPSDFKLFEKIILKPFFGVSLEELSQLKPLTETERNGAVMEGEVISEPNVSYEFKRSENLIYYGPPGTGKTYLLTEQFKKFTSNSAGETVENYLARLVEDKPWWQVVAAAVLDSEKIKVPAMLRHPLIQAKLAQTSIKSPNARLWSTLQSHTVQECPHVNYQNKLDPPIFWKDADSIWMVKEDLLSDLAPEVIELKNKSKQIPSTEIIKRYEFVTFHQSYGYEEFVEGIRPVMEDDVDGEVQYRIEPGIFKKICTRAEGDPGHQYAIFIDEINRGNISKIFGELITLVELDKRLENGSGMRIRLPYSQQEFGVPSNLSIIGTMNTADRSIAFIDIALRRRFQFKEMMPELDVIVEKVGISGVIEGVNVKDLLFKINRRIEFLYDRDHVIGHSYFLKCQTLADLKVVLLENIIPLLQEYFYGDWEKICLVLGCGTSGNGAAQTNASPVIKAEKLDEKEILGFDHLDYEDTWRYEVNPDFIGASGEGLQKFFFGIVSSKKSIGTQSAE
jgi:5-methylcytosine-specific restriction protein B